MKKILLTLTINFLSTSALAAVMATSGGVKNYSFKFKDNRMKDKVVFQTSESASSESEAFKKAAHKCMNQLSDYSTDDALDICANPRS